MTKSITKPWSTRFVKIFIIVSCLLFISIPLLQKFMQPKMLSTLKQNVLKNTRFISTYIDTHEQSVSKTAFDSQTIQLMETVSTSSKAPTQHYANFLTNSLPLKNYKNIYLITNNGDVVFTLNKSYFAGTNVTKLPYKEQPLGRLFKRSLVTRSISLLCVPSTTNFEQQSIFISAPIIKHTTFLGSFIAELNPTELFGKILQNRSIGNNERIFIAQSNHNLIEAMTLYPEQATELNSIRPFHHHLLNATHGDFGSAITTGLKREKNIIAWGYEPDLHIGLLIVLPYNAITFYTTLLWIIGLIFLLVGLALLFFTTTKESYAAYRATWRYRLASFYSALCSYGLYLLCGISIGAFLILLAVYNNTIAHGNAKALAHTNTEMRFLAQQINNILFNMEQIGSRLARQLSKNVYQKEELNALVSMLLENNTGIWGVGIVFNHNNITSLQETANGDSNSSFSSTYRPYWIHTKHGIEKLHFGELTNDNSINQEKTAHGWYTNALRQGAHWQDPYLDPVTRKKIISYSLPFYRENDSLKQDPLGVIVVTYRTSSIHEFIKNLGFKTSQHSIINNQTGLLIYHPNVEFVLQRRTIFDLVHHTTQNANQAVHDHLKEITPGFKWFHDEIIPQTKWTFSSSFTEEDIIHKTKHLSMLLMFLVLLGTFALFFIISLLIKHHLINTTHQHAILTTYSLLIGISTVILWGIIYREQWSHPLQETIVSDNVKLYKILDEFSQTAMSHNAATPVPIRSGIVIDQIDDSHPKETILAATVWQTYNKEQLQKITPGFTVARTKKLIIKKVFEKELGKNIVIGWKMRCHLFQTTDYTRYPFEKKHISLVIEHTDGKHNVICIPDFKHYQISPENLYPWLGSHVDLRKKVENSFFSYNKKESSRDLTNINKKLKLHIISKEDALNPLISYIIPLIVILFSIFALLWLPPSNRIPGFTGIFFATIVLHRALRDVLKIGGLIYLEYLFFLVYFTLLCTTAITIFTYKEENYLNNFYEKVRLYFWPTQATLWLLIAVWIFYH